MSVAPVGSVGAVNKDGWSTLGQCEATWYSRVVQCRCRDGIRYRTTCRIRDGHCQSLTLRSVCPLGSGTIAPQNAWSTVSTGVSSTQEYRVSCTSWSLLLNHAQRLRLTWDGQRICTCDGRVPCSALLHFDPDKDIRTLPSEYVDTLVTLERSVDGLGARIGQIRRLSVLQAEVVAHQWTKPCAICTLLSIQSLDGIHSKARHCEGSEVTHHWRRSVACGAKTTYVVVITRS